VDDFRTKGAVGAFRDAALDACDMVTDAGSMVYSGAKTIVAADEVSDIVVVRSTGVPSVDEQVQAELGNGTCVPAVVLAVDTLASPPRVRILRQDDHSSCIAPVLAPGVPLPEQETAPQGAFGAQLLDDLSKEWQCTVQDFKTKGAAGALKDAALDAVDLLGSATETAFVATKSVAGKTLDLLTGDEEDVSPTVNRVRTQQAVATPSVATPPVPTPSVANKVAEPSCPRASQPVKVSPDDSVENWLRNGGSKASAAHVSRKEQEEELID